MRVYIYTHTNSEEVLVKCGPRAWHRWYRRTGG